MELLPEDIKIKIEKVTPERETVKDEGQKIIQSGLLRKEDERDEKKDVEPTK